DDLARLHEAQRLLEELARRLVRRDHHQKAIDPLPEHSAVGNRYERRGVDDHVVVLLASLCEELPDPRRLQDLVGSGRAAPRRDDRQVQVPLRLRYLLELEIRVDNLVHVAGYPWLVEAEMNGQAHV